MPSLNAGAGGKEMHFTRRMAALVLMVSTLSGGAIAAAGPAIPRDETTRTVDVRDLAPTFLSLLDIPIPAIMDGKPSPFFVNPATVSRG